MTQLAGIVNLSPDSFSGDSVAVASQALARIDAMLDAGAAIIDVGAESTRPGAKLLAPDEEWLRLAPLISVLSARTGKARFSIDTRHTETAEKAVDAGFSIINDVSASAAMRELARVHKVTLVLMHSLSVPADPTQTLPADCDPVEVVCAWAKAALQELKEVPVILDPGIGFGKTPAQSLALIKGIARLKALGVPVMIGHSRKSFLAQFTPHTASERDTETLVVSQWLAGQGVDFLRVHNIEMHAAMLHIRAAL